MVRRAENQRKRVVGRAASGVVSRTWLIVSHSFTRERRASQVPLAGKGDGIQTPHGGQTLERRTDGRGQKHPCGTQRGAGEMRDEVLPLSVI